MKIKKIQKMSITRRNNMKKLIITMLTIGFIAPLNAMQKEDLTRDLIAAVRRR